MISAIYLLELHYSIPLKLYLSTPKDNHSCLLNYKYVCELYTNPFWDFFY